MRKIMNLKMKRMKSSLRRKMSKVYETYYHFMPSEFTGRKPRSLDELPRFKGVEFRQLLLYNVFVLFKEFFSPKEYQYFLLIAITARILYSKQATQQSIAKAEELLHKFVAEYPGIYGEEHVSYNIHNLLHLADCVRLYGAMYDFSTYKFENFNQRLKKLVKSPRNILQQIRKQVHLLNECGLLFQQTIVEEVQIGSAEKNSYFMLKTGVAFQVQEIQENRILGNQVTGAKSLFTEPFNSLGLGIMVIDQIKSFK